MKTPGITTIAFRIPNDLLAQIKAVNSNVSEEIRLRLERSFQVPDKATDDLVNLIAQAAVMAQLDGGWDYDPAAHAMFKAAINLLLDCQKPTGEPDPDRTWFIASPNVSAEDAGRILFNLVTREHKP